MKLKNKTLTIVALVAVILSMVGFTSPNSKSKTTSPPTPIHAEYITPHLKASIESCRTVAQRKIASTIETEEEENAEPYYPITDEDRYIIQCILAGECPYEPWEGQCLVAQCILDAMIKEDYTAAKVRTYYGYMGYDPSIQTKDAECWATLGAVIEEVFDKGNLPTEENVLWFYNPKICRSSWHESQQFVTEVCCHRFFAPW